jgi:hypothetical protein
MAAQTTPISIAFATPRVSAMMGAQANRGAVPACEQPDRRLQPLETGCADAGEVLREHENTVTTSAPSSFPPRTRSPTWALMPITVKK